MRRQQAPKAKFRSRKFVSEKMFESGTVIIAVQYGSGLDGGIVLGADKNVIAGDEKTSEEFEKIMKAGDCFAVGYAGLLGEAQFVNDAFLDNLPENVTLENGEKILRTMLQLFSQKNHRGVVPLQALFAGFDRATGARVVETFDQSAGKVPRGTFAAIGSGETNAAVVFRHYFRKHKVADTNKDKALELTLQVLLEAANNIFVSDPRLVPPAIVILNKDGYRQLSDEEVGEAIKKFL